jgi:hypothetical protein
MSLDERDDGPDVEVWNHLYSGLDLATMELDALDEVSRKAVEKAGATIHAARKQFLLTRDQEMWASLFNVMLRHPWYRFAAELEFGYECVGRASDALSRFVALEPVSSDIQLGEKATRYLREAIDTYVFGFDAAAIAFCGAVVEQVLKDVVVARGIYTLPRLRRERPSGLALLENAKRDKLIKASYDAAKRALDQRNHVMHKDIWDDRISQSVARGSIADLCSVLAELGSVQ